MLIMRVAGLSLVASLLVVSGCGHPWSENRWSWQEPPGPDQQPVITNSEGPNYDSGTPTWAPLIDACMNAGGSRGECIAALPPEELARLEAWEAEQGAKRRSQMALRQTLNTSAETRTFGLFRIDLPPGWLARDDVIVLVTYQCPSQFKDVEKEQIDAVVRSLRATAR